MEKDAILSKSEIDKINRNAYEDIKFSEQVDKFVNGEMKNFETLSLSNDCNVFKLINAQSYSLIMRQNVLRNSMLDESQKANRHNSGHSISLDIIKKLPENLRNPIMILEGQHLNTVVFITDLVNSNDEKIIVPIALDLKSPKGTVNKISTIYGKHNLSNYLQLHHSQIIAYNKEKTENLYRDIGVQFPKLDTIPCYDNSIAYTLANVKYPTEKKEEKTMTEQEMMAQIEAKLRQEFEAKFQKMEQKFTSLEEQVQTINKFMAAMTEAQDLSRTMSEIESVTKQVTNCDKSSFYCYDQFTEKFFTQGNDYREWQEGQSADVLKNAFETKQIVTEGNKTIMPVISSDGSALGVITAEKENGLSEKEMDFFKPNSQIVNTIELALKKEFEHQGRVTDELTHLKNRQGLNEYAADTICGRINDNLPVNIVMCDIDHFKSVNDTYGHDAGDTVLKNVAAILQEGTRTGSDCAFRFGGEEMILILNCEPEKAYEIAERLRSEVEKTEHTVIADGQEKNISVTISMGVYQMSPEIEMTPENSRAVFDAEFKCADELVYNAKETGRNKVVTTAEVMSKVISKNEKAKEQSEKSVHSPHKDYKIFGTISYKDISDKKQINGITAEHINALTDNLQKAGIDYSGIKNEITGKYTISVDGWDNLKAARNIYNNVKSDIGKNNISVGKEITTSEKNKNSPFRDELKKVSEWADGVEKKAAERSRSEQEQTRQETNR